MIRRLLLAARPAETRFFLFVGVFGLALATIYWVVSRELAGTALLGGFGIGGGLLGLRLLGGRRTPMDEGLRGEDATPFGDERGRLPGETLAPLSLGLGLALALTAVVFGPWLAVAGVVPVAWGAWTWLAGARDELDATEAAERPRSTRAPVDDGDVVAGDPGQGPPPRSGG